MDLPISFGAESIIKIRDEVYAHLIQKAVQIEEAFKAFDGRGFKIAFTVKVDREKGENNFEIDMKFDPLPKAHYRRVSKVIDAQYRFQFRDSSGEEGEPVDAEFDSEEGRETGS